MGRRIFKYLKYIFHCIIYTIYSGAEKCIVCGVECEEYLCYWCKNDLKPLYLDSILKENNEEYKCYSLGFYGHSIKKLILLLKYERDFLAGEVISKYLSEFINSKFKKDIDVITFVPCTSKTLKHRGFNQCEIISDNIGATINVPSLSLLSKIKETKDQIGLNHEERWNNIKDSFVCKDSSFIQGKKVLLIDDVLTTGATAFYCASALKNNGAKEVYILTVAKSRV
jgi:competence protein ComFC